MLIWIEFALRGKPPGEVGVQNRECPRDVRGDTRMFGEILGNTVISKECTGGYEDLQRDNGVSCDVQGMYRMSREILINRDVQRDFEKNFCIFVIINEVGSILDFLRR